MTKLEMLRAEWPHIGLKFLGVGHALPSAGAVPNTYMERLVDTSDEWIVSRTGIKERYFCAEQTNIELAQAAAEEAMSRAGIKPEQVGVCLVATFTPDRMSPSLACMLQERLGLPQDSIMFDLNAACAGFLYGLQTARQLLLTAEPTRPYALVLGSETPSRVMDFTDRNTCVLFGDAAAAAVVELSEEKPYLAICGSRTDNENMLYCSGLADQQQGRPGGVVHMQGQEVFRFAVDIIPHSIEQVLARANLQLADIDHVVCHQANNRIISHVVKKMHAAPEQFFINLQHYGNTSSASIPLALNDMWEQGLLKPGQRIICVGFGAGFTWGACLLTW